MWDGQAPDGRQVLVRCHRGLGDTIQFARYLPLLAQRAASVTLEAPRHLLPLFASFAGIARLLPFDPAHPAPASDCDIEITELGFVLRAPPGAAPPPYLHAQPAAPLSTSTVGLCHASGAWDAGRDLAAELLRPICQRHACLTLVAAPSTLPVGNPQGCPLDIIATAALVAALDLVITVDTMIAHLAGALGRPTWLLLQHAPDWRWVPGARATPWYPSMRLYHQPCPGDWEAVIAMVEHDLVAFPQTQGAPAIDRLAEPVRSCLVG